jgi:DNA repair photolyase
MPHLKQVKSVLNKHKKRDSWFLDDYSVNPFEGCSCNCLYCYIRGSKYGENMDSGLAIKSNSLAILEKQLAARARKHQYGFVTVGSGTDAYIQHEEKYKLTEGMLRLLLKYRFPVFISTKRALILRDLELLREIDKNAIIPADLHQNLKRGLILSVSISTMDEKISQMLEPGAITPKKRLELARQLKGEGFLVGVNAIPVLPFISDTDEELEKIISSAKEHDADYILVGGLTLFGSGAADSKTLFYRFLEQYDPSLIPRYQQIYGPGHTSPFKYQHELREKANRICKNYKIRQSIAE